MSTAADLIAEARALIERAADAAPKSARPLILEGRTEDAKLRLLVRLSDELERVLGGEVSGAECEQLAVLIDEHDPSGPADEPAEAEEYWAPAVDAIVRAGWRPVAAPSEGQS